MPIGVQSMNDESCKAAWALVLSNLGRNILSPQLYCYR